MTTPLWVVIPAYQEAGGILRTLQGLTAQTDRGFTLVVVDNGSIDGTAELVRGFAAAAPFPVHVVDEPERGVGYAADTGFRYAIAHGATLLARTDADCLPRAGWVAAARAGLATGAGMVHGRLLARKDENGVAARAWFVVLVALAGAFGRFRRSNRDRAFLAPHRMHAGNNMAISAELYLRVGGMPRCGAPTDQIFRNRVRRHTREIRFCRDMVVENSTRRLRSYGVAGTARWYLGRGSGGLCADPR